MRIRALAAASAMGGVLSAAAACEITEEIIAPGEDVVVVEGLVQLRDSVDGEQRVLVFLHRTVSGERSLGVEGAQVEVALPGDSILVVPQSGQDDCVAATPEIEPAGTCYYLANDEGLGLSPGQRIELLVETAAGERLNSATTIPGEHEILNAVQSGFCWVPPDGRVTVTWTPSDGAWAYFAEALINDLDDALAPEGIEVDTNPFYLTGISASSSDTTIALPSEFGVFDRGSLDQDVALRLQRGLPGGLVTNVAVTALDRNYTNWVRGGNFNPSGQVRIPSVRGEGTGYFGSTVVKVLDVFSVDLEQPSTRCRESG